jgi:hypothetical protein
MKKLFGFLLRKSKKKATNKRLHKQFVEMNNFVKEM